ncbi:MAG: hypothetical protein JJE42_12775 [Burkholderiales bacterium]|nr:hypothetical protein [Burkholderiales bacterium]
MAKSPRVFTLNVRVLHNRVKLHMTRNMRDAAMLLKDKIKTKISVGQPTAFIGGKLRGLNPSVSPEPPKVVTGALRGSIVHTVSREGGEIVGRIGSDSIPYARRLEMGFFGVDGVQARPYLRSSLAENRAEILRILVKP